MVERTGMLDFYRKRILITGGSAGIGLAMARELARRGASIGLLARNQDTLETVVAALGEEFEGDFIALCANVQDRESVAQAIDQFCAHFGGLDGVIANSGLCLPGVFHETTVEDLAQQLTTNLSGALYTLYYAMPRLLASGGFAAVSASPAGEAGIYGFATYGASKAGLIRLVDSLRQEYEDQGVRFHILLPPDTDTPGYEHEITRYPAETRAILGGGRLHSAEKVARILVQGMAKGRYRITVGAETKVFLLVARVCPGLWQWYCQNRIAAARKESL